MKKLCRTLVIGCLAISMLCSCALPRETGSPVPTPDLPQATLPAPDETAFSSEDMRLSLLNNNLPWGGNVVSDGDDLFYSPNDAAYSYCSNVFFCVSLTEKECRWTQEDNAFFINEDDEWIYYVSKHYEPTNLDSPYPQYESFLTDGVCKIKKDTGARYFVAEVESADSMILWDGILYILESGEAILSYTKAGAFLEKYPLQEKDCLFETLQYANGSVFYLTIEENVEQKASLHLQTLSENGVAEICAFPLTPPNDRYTRYCAVLFGEDLYVSDGDGLKRFSITTGECQTICGEGVLSFVLSDEFAFVTLGAGPDDDTSRMIAFSIDGEEKVEIALDLLPMTTCFVTAVDGQRIFYMENAGGGDTFSLRWVNFEGETDTIDWYREGDGTVLLP